MAQSQHGILSQVLRLKPWTHFTLPMYFTGLLLAVAGPSDPPFPCFFKFLLSYVILSEHMKNNSCFNESMTEDLVQEVNLEVHMIFDRKILIQQ